jgi:hypothetical protein
MPKDKRLLICRALLDHIQRSVSKEEAQLVAMDLHFVIPPKALAPNDEFRTKKFQLPQSVYVSNGRHTAVILPADQVFDAKKVNTRHKLCDAVVPAESICARDGESQKRAVQVAAAFQKFVVDERAMPLLPAPLRAATSAAGGKDLVVLRVAEKGQDFVLALQLCCKAVSVTVDNSSGLCRVRVGHAGMTAGDLNDNARTFINTLKQQYPHLYKHIAEFKLHSTKSEPIRYIEAHITR